MSLVVLGLSHRSAPLEVLEAVALDPARAIALTGAVRAGDSVTEAVVLSTCNRLEVYAEAATFHGAVSEIGDAVAAAAGVPLPLLSEHLYVHYEDRAIAHLFQVACGLDSMAVGEAQVLGQLREALRSAQQAGPVTALNPLFQQALRVGKKAHTDTGIDSVTVSLVEAGIAAAGEVLGPLEQQRVLLVGAGSMSGLTAATARRLGARNLVVLSRTRQRAERVAAASGGRARPWADLTAAVADADLVMSCTGAVGHVLSVASFPPRRTTPVVVVDLALPRDVDPAVGALPGVRLFALAELGARLRADGSEAEQLHQVQQVQDLVVAEVAAYLTGRRASAVAPTVAALRSRAAEVMAAELNRLDQRVPDLSARDRAEVQLAVHRVVEKLLHTPTIRVKQLTVEGMGDYEQALRELFDLDPHDIAAVSAPPDKGPLL
ncbi:MAG TPA: glutamyl-tRNA reductase [Dermatophilaceae bacterium]|nr:glutamyl-tRNA reductase [Dermatophilaceae bacterium]